MLHAGRGARCWTWRLPLCGRASQRTSWTGLCMKLRSWVQGWWPWGRSRRVRMCIEQQLSLQRLAARSYQVHMQHMQQYMICCLLHCVKLLTLVRFSFSSPTAPVPTGTGGVSLSVQLL